jgi:enoyl-CoA hydratase/carnithine racemase
MHCLIEHWYTNATAPGCRRHATSWCDGDLNRDEPLIKERAVPTTKTQIPPNSYNGFATLNVAVVEGVATLTINNPPLNLLDASLMTDLDRFAEMAADDASVRVIVFESADPDFFIPHGDMNFVDDPSSFASLAIGGGEDARLNPMQRLFERYRKLPQVTIGKLRGYARGGGAELLEALDMRFASLERGFLAQMETPTGIIPGAGGTVYLPRLVGRGRALEIVLGAGLFNAATAERYGWINRALPDAELDVFVDRLARNIAALPDGIIAAGKEAVDANFSDPLDALLEQNRLLGETFSKPAAAELTRRALRKGAQTRDGERELETILTQRDE